MVDIRKSDFLFETHSRNCVVSLRKTLNALLNIGSIKKKKEIVQTWLKNR